MQPLALSTLVLVFAMTFAEAQTTASTHFSSFENLANTESDENWSFYIDEENQLYFIDFETINVNLSDIIVKSDEGEILLREDVFELPVNTIYEIDFSPYGAGTYHIELRSFTGMMQREVSIP